MVSLLVIALAIAIVGVSTSDASTITRQMEPSLSLTETLFPQTTIALWDTECYLVIRQTSTESVKQYSRIPFLSREKP